MTELYFVEKFCSWSRRKITPATRTPIHALLRGDCGNTAAVLQARHILAQHVAEGKAETVVLEPTI